jgi:hypothetical protein
MVALGPQIELQRSAAVELGRIMKRYAKWIAGAAQVACCDRHRDKPIPMFQR